MEGTEIVDITQESKFEKWDQEHDSSKRMIKGIFDQ
jgi:hypothetical protein